MRQADLGRLVKLAAEFDDGERTTRDFVAELEERFGTSGPQRRGVNLLTLHGAKGLEFEAVFLPRLEEKELPIRQAKPRRGRRGAPALLRRPHPCEALLAVTWCATPARSCASSASRRTVPRRPPVESTIRLFAR